VVNLLALNKLELCEIISSPFQSINHTADRRW